MKLALFATCTSPPDDRDCETQSERAYEQYYEERRQERRDVPLVEDFPLAPREETLDFKHLTITLELRMFRAHEHWNANPVILRDIIERRFKDDSSGAIQ